MDLRMIMKQQKYHAPVELFPSTARRHMQMFLHMSYVKYLLSV